MSLLAPASIHCPSCNAWIARHRWFVTKRVRDLSCRHCGAQLEVTLPPWRYHLSALAISLIGELFALALLVFLLANLWLAIALAIGVFLAIDYARGAWLSRRASVRWINQGSMERRAAGRWTPD